MKLTESQLRKIIRQEARRLTEGLEQANIAIAGTNWDNEVESDEEYELLGQIEQAIWGGISDLASAQKVHFDGGHGSGVSFAGPGASLFASAVVKVLSHLGGGISLTGDLDDIENPRPHNVY